MPARLAEIVLSTFIALGLVSCEKSPEEPNKKNNGDLQIVDTRHEIRSERDYSGFEQLEKDALAFIRGLAKRKTEEYRINVIADPNHPKGYREIVFYDEDLYFGKDTLEIRGDGKLTRNETIITDPNKQRFVASKVRVREDGTPFLGGGVVYLEGNMMFEEGRFFIFKVFSEGEMNITYSKVEGEWRKEYRETHLQRDSIEVSIDVQKAEEMLRYLRRVHSTFCEDVNLDVRGF